jgi:hypothetical protein
MKTLNEAVVEFVQECIDDGKTTFEFEDAEKIAISVGMSVSTYAVRALKEYGLVMLPRPIEKRIRGFKSNNHDRWNGPGACKSHGGSGSDQIIGLAGRKG